VGLFGNIDKSRNALEGLQAEGYRREDISLIANDTDRRFSELFGDDAGSVDHPTGEDTAKGAGTGAVLGGLAGLVVGLAALTIPGIGWIIAAGPVAAILAGAGPVATTLAGAGIGAVAGGLIGPLQNMGISEHDAHFYAESVRHGGTLLVLRADDDLTQRAIDIMRDSGATSVDQGVEAFEQSSQGDEERQQQRAATNAAAAAVGAANYAGLGAPGAPGAIVGALTTRAAGNSDVDMEELDRDDSVEEESDFPERPITNRQDH
jgi:hypothetical protein